MNYITYKSITGHIVSTRDTDYATPEIYPKSVLSLFECPISKDICRNPVYLPSSKQIYDYFSINEWLDKSDKDPLTGIKFDVNMIKFVPIINYYLAMLCIEEKDDHILFHPPFGNLFDLLIIAHRIFHRNYELDTNYWQMGHNTRYTISEDGVTHPFEYIFDEDLQNGIVHLDLIKYIPRIYLTDTQESLSKKTTGYKIKPVSLKEILTKCVMSDVYIYDNYVISERGFFVNKNEYKNKKYLGSLLDNYFKNAYNFCYNKIYDTFGFNNEQNNENIENNKVINWKQNPYYYTCYNWLLNLFVKKHSPYIICDKYAISIDEKDYREYTQILQKINSQTLELLQKMLTDKKNLVDEQDRFHVVAQPYTRHTYTGMHGDDYSFLTLDSRLVAHEYLKCYYFNHSILNKMVFVNCTFSNCKFINTVFNDCYFKDCKFNNCSFYKSSISIKDLSIKNNALEYTYVFENNCMKINGSVFDNCSLDKWTNTYFQPL